MEVALWRLPRVQQATGLKKSFLYELVRRGQFPGPVKIGARAVAWDANAVNGWIRSRIDTGGRQ